MNRNENNRSAQSRANRSSRDRRVMFADDIYSKTNSNKMTVDAPTTAAVCSHPNETLPNSAQKNNNNNNNNNNENKNNNNSENYLITNAKNENSVNHENNRRRQHQRRRRPKAPFLFSQISAEESNATQIESDATTSIIRMMMPPSSSSSLLPSENTTNSLQRHAEKISQRTITESTKQIETTAPCAIYAEEFHSKSLDAAKPRQRNLASPDAPYTVKRKMLNKWAQRLLHAAVNKKTTALRRVVWLVLILLVVVFAMTRRRVQWKRMIAN